MAFYEIPLIPGNPQTLTIALGAKTYRLRTHFSNAEDGGWYLDISDAQNNPMICGLALVTGIDLLSQFRYLGIPIRLYVRSDGPDPTAAPTFEGFGVTSHLYYEPF